MKTGDFKFKNHNIMRISNLDSKTHVSQLSKPTKIIKHEKASNKKAMIIPFTPISMMHYHNHYL